MRHISYLREVCAIVITVLAPWGTVALGASAPVGEIELGVILATGKEDHCFMFGNLGLSREKSVDYLSGLGHELAFSEEMEPGWPKWDSVRITSIYCHAGSDGAARLAEIMENPGKVMVSQTLDELLENCNCVFLVNTGGKGEHNAELVSACIDAGRPVFVDKFLSPDPLVTRTLLKKAREKGVPLLSTSLLWFSEPGLKLKKRLEANELTKVVSTGWSGGNIAADIHAIAHLQMFAHPRRPTHVRHVDEDGPKAIVTFDDGLVGELGPRRPGTIFEIQAVADGKTHVAHYEGKHSRPAAVGQLSFYFDYVRGKNVGLPPHVMADAIAIWNAAGKARKTGGNVRCAELDPTSRDSDQRLGMKNLRFHSPTVANPYYHFTVRLDLSEEGPVYIHELRANSQELRNYWLFEEGERHDPSLPRMRKRLAIAKAIKSPRPETKYERPTLLGRLDWRNSQSYDVEVAISIGKKEGKVLHGKIDAAAPATGGFWNEQWDHYQSVVVTETAGYKRISEPVEVTFLFYPDQMHEPEREIRVFHYDWHRQKAGEIPCQVVDVETVEKSEEPKHDEKGRPQPATYLPTGSATIVFPANVEANTSNVYLVFYGNAEASDPNVAGDLKISGKIPGVTVENAFYLLKLHDLSGMLDEVTMKVKPQYTFVHKKETNGAIQWNPGCYAPPRAWAHLSDWKPGKYDYQYDEDRGPLVYRTRRWGQMPLMPELACSMEYEFYNGVPYFKMRSAVRVKRETAVQAIRNGEVVFAREVFSEAAWWDPILKRVETREITAAPDLTEWIVPADTPWIAFFDREKGCGYAGIQISCASAGLTGRLRTLNPYMYVTTGPWIYWTRALAYPYGSRNPQQLIKIGAESVFLEQWAYLPFELSKEEGHLFQTVQDWSEILTHPLHIHLEDPIDPRMEIPEEIYIEPSKTGWEE